MDTMRTISGHYPRIIWTLSGQRVQQRQRQKTCSRTALKQRTTTVFNMFQSAKNGVQQFQNHENTHSPAVTHRQEQQCPAVSSQVENSVRQHKIHVKNSVLRFKVTGK